MPFLCLYIGEHDKLALVPVAIRTSMIIRVVITQKSLNNFCTERRYCLIIGLRCWKFQIQAYLRGFKADPKPIKLKESIMAKLMLWRRYFCVLIFFNHFLVHNQSFIEWKAWRERYSNESIGSTSVVSRTYGT